MHIDDRHRRAAAAGGVGFWDWNLATGEIHVDPVLKEMLGYQDHEIRNHLDDWGRLVHPDDAAAVFEQAQAHIAGRTPAYEVEHRMVHRDGSIRWFLARGSLIRDEQGTPVGMTGSDTDITERKRSEEALRQAEELNKRIVAEHRRLREDPRLGRPHHLYQSRRAEPARNDGCQGVAGPSTPRVFRGRGSPAGRGSGCRGAQWRAWPFSGDAAYRIRHSEVVGHRGDADHRRERGRRPVTGSLARCHRTATR